MDSAARFCDGPGPGVLEAGRGSSSGRRGTNLGFTLLIVFSCAGASLGAPCGLQTMLSSMMDSAAVCSRPSASGLLQERCDGCEGRVNGGSTTAGREGRLEGISIAGPGLEVRLGSWACITCCRAVYSSTLSLGVRTGSRTANLRKARVDDLSFRSPAAASVGFNDPSEMDRARDSPSVMATFCNF